MLKKKMIVLESKNKIKENLRSRLGQRCLFNEEMKYYTSYRIGGTSDILLFPATVQEWRFVFNFCKFNDIALTVLGLGSNVLVHDKGIRGVTATTNLMKEITVEDNIVTAKAGNFLDDLVKTCVENGLSGLEKLSGIPGSVGGGVFMNAGAFGQEIFDNLLDFQAIDYSGCVKLFKKEDVNYSYRKVDNVENSLILSARWKLDKANPAELEKTRKEILTKRAKKQPLQYPNAGSVFKRPEGDFASRLIDASGLKGLRIGDAMVSTKHAGFIVNMGDATAKEVYDLIITVQEKVKKKTNISLELEQKLLGKF